MRCFLLGNIKSQSTVMQRLSSAFYFGEKIERYSDWIRVAKSMGSVGFKKDFFWFSTQQNWAYCGVDVECKSSSALDHSVFPITPHPVTAIFHRRVFLLLNFWIRTSELIWYLIGLSKFQDTWICYCTKIVSHLGYTQSSAFAIYLKGRELQAPVTFEDFLWRVFSFFLWH